jgi:hypothetical protein
MQLQRPWNKRKSAFPSSPRYGIVPHETFAVKSMDVNFNRLKLKLDMVYRDLTAEEAQKRFEEIMAPPPAPAPPQEEAPKKKKSKRKVVKALVPKNK